MIYMKGAFEKEGLSEQQAAERLSRLIESSPYAAQFADELFLRQPTSAEDLQKRKAAFDTIWELSRYAEQNTKAPEVVMQAKQEGFQEGQKQAKTEAKKKLTTTRGGQSGPSELSRAERVKKAAEKGDQGFVELLLESDKLFSNL